MKHNHIHGIRAALLGRIASWRPGGRGQSNRPAASGISGQWLPGGVKALLPARVGFGASLREPYRRGKAKGGIGKRGFGFAAALMALLALASMPAAAQVSPPFVCATSDVYAITGGATSQRNISRLAPVSGALTPNGSFTVQGIGDGGQPHPVNALALPVGGGQYIYGVEMAGGGGTNSQDVRNGLPYVLRYDTITGGTTPYAITTSSISFSVIAGAFDPITGYYFFARTENGTTSNSGNADSSTPNRWGFYAFNPGNGQTVRVANLTRAQMGYTSSSDYVVNGDMAFDALGNLYVVVNTASGATGRIVRVNGPMPTTGVGTGAGVALTATPITTVSGSFGAYDGIAFRGDGSLAIASTAGVKTVNPENGATLTTASVGATTTDLASCSFAQLLRAQKNLPNGPTGRVNAADQFTLTITGPGINTYTATTTGSTPGLQTAMAGPALILDGQTYTVTETASGSTNLSGYASSWECKDLSTNTVLSSSSNLGAAPPGASLTVAKVMVPTADDSANIMCTFTNTPVPTVDLAVTKTDYTTTYVSGQSIAYYVTVTNNSATTAADGAIFTDPAVAGLTVNSVDCNSAAGGAVCPIGPTVTAMQGSGIVIPTLPAGGSMIFRIQGVVTLASGNLTNTATVAPPAGYVDSNPANNSASDTDTPAASHPITCGADTIYTLFGATGATARGIFRINPTTNAPGTQIGTLTGGLGVGGQWNGLAVQPNGDTVYAVLASGVSLPGDANKPGAVMSYNLVTMTSVVSPVPTLGAYASVSSSPGFIAGAVDPVNGWYYAASPVIQSDSNSSWGLFAYNPAWATTGNTQPPIFVGSIAATASNGDLAFDSLGNLYLVSGGSTGSNIYRVNGPMPTTAGNPATVGNNPLPATVITSTPLPASLNGIAFNNGILVVAAVGGTYYNVDPATGAQIGASYTNTNGVDLASCQYPNTIRLQKSLPSDRFATGDQFTLTITGGGITLGNSAATTSTTSGLQTPIAGPVFGQSSTAYTITETASGSILSHYASSWQCVDTRNGNTVVQSGTSTTGSFTMPAGNNSDILCTFINTPTAPNITLNKSGPATAVAGGNLAYTIGLGNSGDGASGATLTVTDVLPAGVTYNSVTPGTGVTSVSCTAAGQTLTCTVNLTAALAAGAPNGTAAFTINTTAPGSAGSITNYASTDPTGGTNPPTPGSGCTPATSCGSATTTVSVPPNVTLNKTGPATALTNGNIAYTIGLGNSGAGASGTTIVVQDVLPPGVTFVNAANGAGVSTVTCMVAGQTLNCTVTLTAPLAAGAPNGTAAFTINTTAPSTAGSITNYASTDPTGGTNPPTPGPGCTPTTSCGSATTTVNTPANITLNKTGPATALINGSLVYTIGLGNSGQTASGTTLTVTDVLPAGVTYGSATIGTGVSAVTCTAAGQTLTCTVTLSAPLAAGAPNGTATFTINTTAPSTAGSITNYASTDPTGGTNPPTPGPGCTPATSCGSAPTTVNTPANITLEKTGPATVLTNGNLVYTIGLGNSGQTASGLILTVTDVLPAGVTFVNATSGTGVSAVTCTAAGQTLTCTVTLSAPLAAGAPNGTAAFTINTTAPSTAGSITNYASTDPNGGTNPPTPGPGCTPATSCGSAPTDVNTPANITLEKSGPATVLTNGSLVYTIGLGNSGQTASGLTLTVTDVLPAGVTYGSATIGTGVSAVTCTAAGQTLTCTVTLSAPLAAGAPNGTATFTINTTAPATAGSITNYASTDPTGGTNPPTPGPGCTPATSCGSAPTDVNTPANITLEKTGPATVLTNGSLVYTIGLGNSGQTASGTTLTVTDVLPAGVTYGSATIGTGVSAVTCTAAGQTLTCTVSLTTALAAGAPNGTAAFTINTTAPSTAGSITNYASTDPAGGTNPPTPGPGCTPATSCGSAPTDVNTPANITLEKSGPATVLTNGSLVYTIGLGNSGGTASGTTLTVTDVLPAGVTYGSATIGTGVSAVTCTAAGQTLTCTITLSAPLAAGAPNGTATFTINTTAPSTAGSITNYASTDPTGGTNPPTPGPGCTPATSCGSAPTEVNTPAGVSVVKTGPATVLTNGSLQYTLTLANSGTTPSATTLIVEDQLPAGVTFVSAAAGTNVTSVSCTGTSLLTCSVVLPAGLTNVSPVTTFLVNATAPATAGTITNYAATNPPGDGNPPVSPPGPNCDPVTTSCTSVPTDVNTPAGVSVVKTGPATVLTNGSLQYTLTLANSGTTPSATTLVVEDQLPAGVTFVSATAGTNVTSVNCTGTSLLTCSVVLPAGLTNTSPVTTFLVNATAPAAAGTITNYAATNPPGDGNPPVSPPGPDCDPVTTSCTSVPTDVNTPANITLEKSGPATVLTNGSLVYTIGLGNSGQTASGLTLTVTDVLPAGVTYGSATIGTGVSAVTCTAAGQTLTCTVTLSAPLAAGAPNGTAAFTINTTAPSTAGSITNYASTDPTGGTNPPTPGPGCTPATSCGSAPTDVNTPANITLEKTGPATVLTNGNLVYTIGLGNSGQTASGLTLTVTDVLPAGVTYGSVTAGTNVASVNCTAAGQTLTCTVNLTTALAAGAPNGAAMFTINTTAPATAGSITNYASTDPTGGTNPPTPGTDCTPATSCGSATTDVNTPAGVSVVKTGPAMVLTNGSLQYTLTLANSGTTPSATTLVVEDQLPPGVTFVSAAAGTNVTSVTCTGTSLLTCTIVLPAGLTNASPVTTFLVNATAPSTAGTITNYAATNPPGDGNPPVSPPGPSCDPVTTSCTSVPTDVNTPAGVSVVKTGPATVLTNGSLQYTLTLANSGTTPSATTLIVEDQLPPGVTFVSAAAGTNVTSVNCTGTSLLTCSVVLPAGLTNASPVTTFLVNATAPATAGTITNYAATNPPGDGNPPVSPPGPDCDPATTSCTSVPTDVNTPAGVSVVKTGPATVLTNGSLQYTLTLANSGTTPSATTLVVEDQLPPGVTFVSAAAGTNVTSVSCTGTSLLTCSVVLPAGLTNASPVTTFLVNATAPATAGTITNYAATNPPGDGNPPVSPPGPDCDPVTTSCTSVPTDVNTPAGVSVVKTGPATVLTNGSLQYTLTLANSGTTPSATTLVVEDQLPAGVTFVSAQAGTNVTSVNCTGTSLLTCSVVLPLGLTNVSPVTTFLVNATAPSTAGTITNYAATNPPGDGNPPVSPPGPSCDPVTTSCTSVPTDVNTPAGVSVVKTGPATVLTNGNLQYTLTLANSGTTPSATTLVIEDQLPAGVTFVSAQAGTNVTSVSCTGTSLLTCSVVLPAGLTNTSPVTTFLVNATAPATAGTITNYAATNPPGDGNPPVSPPGPGCDPVTTSCTSVPTDVSTPAGVSVVKTGPATVLTNGSLQYTLTLSNSGTTPSATTLIVEDQLPAGVTFVSAAAGTNVTSVSCTGTSLLTCSVVLPAGLTNASPVTTFLVNTTAPATAGTITNYAATNPPGDGNPPVSPPGPDCDPVTTSCTSVPTDVNTPANITLEKTGPATVLTNGNLVYTIGLGNSGQTASGLKLTVTDVLPAGVTYNSVTAGTGVTSVNCTAAGQTLTCTVNLTTALAAGAPNGTAAFTINTTAPATAGSITNYASTDPTGGTNPPTPGPSCTPATSCGSAPTDVNTPAGVSVVKTGPATVLTNGSLQYTLTLANSGTTPSATTLIVEDQLPPGVTFVSAAAGTNVTSVNCTGTSLLTCSVVLPAGLTNASPVTTFLVNATAPSTAGTITNYAATNPPGDGNPPVSPPGPGCDPVTTSCTSVPTDVNTPAGVSVVKTGPATVLTNGSLQYTLTLANSGTTPSATTLVVEDQLPPGVTFVSAAAGTNVTSVTCTGTSLLTCTIVLPAGLTNASPVTTFLVNATAPSTAGTITNYAATNPPGDGNPPVSPPGPSCDPVTTSCTSVPTDVNTPANITLEKTGPATVLTNGSLVYTIGLGNSGQTASGLTLTVTDVLPAGVTYGSATIGTGVSAVTCTAAGQTLTCTVSLTIALAAGAPNGTAAFTINTTAPATAGNITNYASTDPTGGTNPPTPGPSCTPATSCGSASTDVNTPANITLEKTGPATVLTNGSLVYTIGLGNSGQTASGLTLTVTDVLPAGVTYGSATIGTGVSAVTCTAAGQTLTCTVTLSAPLAAGAPNGTATFTINTTAPAMAGSITNYASTDPTGGTNPPTPGPGCTPATSCGSAPTDVNTPAGVSVVKTGPATVLTNGSLQYTLTLANSGTTPSATTLVVEDQLPPGVTFVSAQAGTNVISVSCTGTSLLMCSVVLPAGLTNASPVTTFLVNATAPSTAGTITNYASTNPPGDGNPPVSPPGPDCDPVTTSCTSVPTGVNTPAGVSVVKTGPATVLMNGSLQYTLALANSGTTPSATTLIVEDQLPPGVTFVSAQAGTNVTSVSCTGTSLLTCSVVLPAGLTNASPVTTFLVNATAPATAGTITNYAATNPPGDGNPPVSPPGPSCDPVTTSCTSVPTDVNTPAGVSVVKTGPATVLTNGSLQYTLTLANSGTTPSATTLIVEDQLPAGVTFISAAAGTNVTSVSCTGTSLLTCSVVLPAGLTNASPVTTFLVNATAPATAGTITNYAATNPPGDGNPPVSPPGPSCDAVTTSCTSVPTDVNTPAGVSVVKTGPATVLTNGSLQYTLTLANSGTTPSATTLIVEDQLPAGVTFISAAAGTNVTSVSCTGTSLLTCSVVLPAGLTNASPVTTFLVNATAPATAGTITNYASTNPPGDGNPPVSPPGPDCDPATTSCTSVPTDVNTPAGVSVVKTGPATVLTNGSLQYTLTLANSGTTPSATTLIVEDQLPPGVTFVSAQAGTNVTSVSCTGTSLLTCSVVLPAGLTNTSPVTTFLVNTTAPTTAGTITNYAATNPPGDGNPPVSPPGSGCDPVTTSCTSVPTDVNTPANITLEKSGPATVLTNGNLVYTIGLGNSGQTASGLTLTVTDVLPAGVTYGSVTAGTGVTSVNCTAAGQTLTCTVNLTTALAAGAPNGTATFTINTTAPATAGSITNYASTDPTGGTNPPTPGPGCTPATSCGSATTDVNTPAAVTTVKTLDPGVATPIVGGEEIIYVLTASNSGSTAAVGYTINEVVPANTTFTAVADGTTSASSGCSGGETAGTLCTVTFASVPGATGGVPGTATVLVKFTAAATIPDGTLFIANEITEPASCTDSTCEPPPPPAGCTASPCTPPTDCAVDDPHCVKTPVAIADMQASAPATVVGTIGVPVNVTTICSNAGPNDAVNPTCVVTGAPAGATTTCDPPSANPFVTGSTIVCHTTFTPTDPTPVTLVTTAGSDTPDPNLANNVAQTIITAGSITPAPDSGTTPFNTPITIAVTTNDQVDGGTVNPASVVPTQPAHGSVTCDAAGNCTYTPTPGFTGIDTYTYTVCDNSTPPRCGSTTVTIVVGPQANDDNVPYTPNTPSPGNAAPNDVYPPGSTFTKTTDPGHGTVVMNPDGTFVYTPASGYTGPDSFTYTVCEPAPNQALCSTATVNLTPPNLFDPPFITKAVNEVDAQTLHWSITVDNDKNAAAQITQIRDPLPAGMTFVSGVVTCQSFGASTVSNCAYDAANNRIVADAVLQSDLGNTDPATAPNRLVVSFDAQYTTIPVPVTNVASACWDAANDSANVSACTQAVTASASHKLSTPSQPPVPVPLDSRWSLILLGLIFATMGLIHARRPGR